MQKKQSDHPLWSYSANIYEVNIRQYSAEGNFDSFGKHLLRLKEMGIKILWFMPIYPIGEQDRLGSLGSYYSIRDYKAINPEFGTLNDFIKLVTRAHALDFKVIIDIVANHTSNDHHWIREHPEYYVYMDAGEVLHPEGWTDVAKLDYNNPAVHKAMIDVLKFWITTCDVDGFRCDMAHLVPLDFWIEARKKMNERKKDLFWLAECEVPAYHAVFDATYTWSWMHATQEFIQGKMNLHSLQTVLYKSAVEFPCNAFRAYFTSNHDENSWNGTEYEKYGDAAPMLAVFSCTWNSIPIIYSGQELPLKRRLKFFDKDPIDWSGECEMQDFYKTLLELRTRNKALHAGRESGLTKIVSHPEDPHIFSFLQKNGASEVLVVLNFSATSQHFTIKQVHGVFRNVFGGPDLDLAQNRDVWISDHGYLVFEKIE